MTEDAEVRSLYIRASAGFGEQVQAVGAEERTKWRYDEQRGASKRDATVTAIDTA